MRFLNRPTIDVNDSNQKAYFDTTNNVLGITGEISLSKDNTDNLKTYLKASSALSNNYTLTLPPNSGLPGQVLSTDGTGTLRFSNPDIGGNRVFVSAKNGNDANDGFNQPVKTIKRAAQIASGFSTPVVDPGQSAYDSQSLLMANKAFIAAEVISFINYCVTNGISPFDIPNFTYNQTTCNRDIGYIVEAVVYDLIFGGNAQSIYAGSSYYSATATVVRDNQKAQSVSAINYAKYVSAAVLNNTNLAPTSGGFYDFAPYQTVIRQTKDLTKSPSSNNKTAIDASYSIITGLLAATSINNYLTANNITRVNPLYKSQGITIQIAAGEYYEDNPIITPDKSTVVGDDLRSVIIRPLNPGKDMFRVRNGMYMSGFTFRDALDANDVPVTTWNYAIAFDDVYDYTVDRGSYSGLSPSMPVVTTSPYIQNCSIISFLGGNGVIADGSKVATPNTSRIPQEEENPVSGPTPSQGRSVIANAFTMLSFGGTGWKIINNAYAQLVSCFQIFMLNGVYAESGGYVSITNSATNFGTNALRSAGYSPTTFDFDKGIIANVGADNSGYQTITSLGHGRVPVNHYVLKIKSKTDGSDITSNYKSGVVKIKTFDSKTDIDGSLDQITISAHGFNSGDSVYYTNDGTTNIGLINGDIYYVYYINDTTISLYYDSSLTKKVNISTTTSINSTHTLSSNLEEFYVNEITDYHNSYQTLTLSSGSYTFTPGKEIQGTVGVRPTSAYVYSWNSSSRELVVSLVTVSNGSIRSKLPFDTSSTINADHAVSPNNNISITNAASRTDLYTGTYTVRSTINFSIASTNSLQSNYVWLNKPSIVNSSGHTWEYSGSGTDYNALPDNGGKTIVESQQVQELPGRVYTSGTNELGDFTVGNFITAYNRTGNIVFNNKVTVSELTALKLSLSSVTIDSISTDVGLGDNEPGGAKNSRLSTQKAMREFIANRLGDFIDKHVSTNSVPAAIVQLNGTGQINADLIPALRGFNTHLVNSYNGRLSLYEKIPVEEVLSGDIVTESYDQITLILSGPISISAGSVVTQASTGAYGTVKDSISSSSTLILIYVTGTFDINPSHTLSSGSSLEVYLITVGTLNSTSDNYYLTKDNTSQFLRLKTTNNYRFTIGNTVTAAINTAQGTITDYRSGYISGLVSGSLVSGSGYTPGGSTKIYYNVPLTGGTGKYTSAAGATSSTTTITVTSTTGLEIGMLVTVTAGTGAFVAGTTVTGITDSTHFTVSQTPSTPLSGGSTVIRGDATGAYADITVSSGIVSLVSLYRGGYGYQAGDVLSAAASNIGGTVTVAFSVPVATIEKRLYINVDNGVKFLANSTNNDFIEDNNASYFTITLDNSTVLTFNANSTENNGDVNYSSNRIIFPNAHGLTDGDPLNYSNSSNTPIGNLEPGETYYAGFIDPNIIELYVDYAKNTKKIFGTSSTGTHSLTRYAVDINSDHIVKLNHGLTFGQSIKISNFSSTAPTAFINGSNDPIAIPSSSRWFVGSVTTNSFTLHQYIVDAQNSVLGVTDNPLDLASTGNGSAKFTLQNASIISEVSTSSKNTANYSVLSNTALDVSNIISGTLSTSRLGSGLASSTSYLRGDSTWHTAVESISAAPGSPVNIAGNYTTETVTVAGISGIINSTNSVTTISSISDTSQLFAGMTLTKNSGTPGSFGGTTTILSVDSPFEITISASTNNVAGSLTFTATASVNEYYSNSTFDVNRVDGIVTGSGTFTNTGVASFDKTYFTIGTGTHRGQVSLIQSYASSPGNTLNAATLGAESYLPSYFLNPDHLTSAVQIAQGGTNITSYSAGDILYATGTTTLSKLNIGSSGYVLTSTGSIPQWTGYTGSSKGSLTKIVYNDGPTIDFELKAGSSTFDLVNTTATTLNFAAAATTFNIGYLGSSASTTNISTGPIKASTVKTINIGTGGDYSSTTTINLGYTGSGSADVNIGSNIGGTTTIRSGTVVGVLTTQNLFNTVATTGNLFGAATTSTVGYSGSATATTVTQNYSIGYVGSSSTRTVNFATGYIGSNTTSTINFATGYLGSNATSTINIGTGYIGSNATNTINIGTGAVSTNATTTVNVGANAGYTGSGSTNVNIGSDIGGTTTIRSGTVVGVLTTQNLYNTTATTVNFASVAETLNVGYTGSSTATSYTQNYSTGYIGSSATHTINIGTGYVGSGSTNTINIGTGTKSTTSTTSINIGSTSGTTTLTVGSSLTGTVVKTGITSSSITVDSWALATYRSAKYILQVTCTASTGSNINTYQVSEVLVIHNGTTATMTEYAAIKTTNDLVTFTVDCNNSSNGLVRLLAAANSGDTITVKLHKILMVV